MPGARLYQAPKELSNFMVIYVYIHTRRIYTTINSKCRHAKKVVGRMTKEIELYKRSNINPSLFLILDDCPHDASWTRDSNIRLFFMNGRHYKTLFIITMQWRPVNTSKFKNQYRLRFYSTKIMLVTEKEFMKIMRECFPPLIFFVRLWTNAPKTIIVLVINNNAKSNKLEEQVFW